MTASRSSKNAAASRKRWAKHYAADELAEAADEYERFAYIAHVARVKRDLLIRKAHREGASLRQIAERIGISYDKVKRVWHGPEPDIHRRSDQERNLA